MTTIADGIAASRPTDLLPEGVARRWALVVRTEVYDAWVIAWPAGSGLAMHDHDGSAAAVAVVDGCLRERYVRADGSVAVRWLEPGGTVHLPHDHVHEVVNPFGREAVSVHVYSPPLADVSFRVDPDLDVAAPQGTTDVVVESR